MDEKEGILLHLHEVLQQHQEPFHLQTYISDKRSESQSQSQTKLKSSSASPCARFLHVPSGTAALLIEAATRIQNTKTRAQIRNVGRTLFGSLFKKILKHRSKVERNCDSQISCRLGLCTDEARLGSNRPLQSPNSFSARLKQEEENVIGVEEEKEQCSPVSVLDLLYEGEDEDEDEDEVVEHESLVGEEEDYDVERSYANIERARKNLLERLERFEKLAALDEVDLEQKLLEESELVEFEQRRACSKQGLWSRSSLGLKLKESTRIKIMNNKKLVIRCCQDAIDDVMVEVDLQFKTEVEETAIQMELAIFEDLMEQCFCI